MNTCRCPLPRMDLLMTDECHYQKSARRLQLARSSQLASAAIANCFEEAEQMRWPVKIFAIVVWGLMAGTLPLWHGWAWAGYLILSFLFIGPYLGWARHS